MIFGCSQAISTLSNAFSIFINTHFNLHLPKFKKSHNLFEFNRRETIFLEIKCLELAVRLIPICDVHMVVSFFGVQFQSKHLRENEKKLLFCNNFGLRFLL